MNDIFNIYNICNIGSWGQSKSFKLQGLRAFGPSSNSTSTLSFLAPRTCEDREPKRFRDCTYRTQTKILSWFNLFLFQHISCALGQSARNFERASAITSKFMQYYAVSYNPCFKFRCKKSQVRTCIKYFTLIKWCFMVATPVQGLYRICCNTVKPECPGSINDLPI